MKQIFTFGGLFMNKKPSSENTNLDIIENLEKKLNPKPEKKVKPKKDDEYAMLKEDYLDYSK
jgi:hypothetical protein